MMTPGLPIAVGSVAAALAFVAVAYWLIVRILHKAGYSGWWCLTMLLPVVNLIMVWVFAFASWPRLRSRGGR